MRLITPPPQGLWVQLHDHAHRFTAHACLARGVGPRGAGVITAHYRMRTQRGIGCRGCLARGPKAPGGWGYYSSLWDENPEGDRVQGTETVKSTKFNIYQMLTAY